MRIFNKIIKGFLNIAFYIGAVALVFTMLFVVVSIALRTMNNAIPGTVEIVTNANVVVAWMGFGLCALRDGHIRVDIFKKAPIFDRVWAIVTLGGLILFGIKTLDQGAIAYALGTTTGIIHFIKWPFYYVVAIGYFAMALAILYHEVNYYVNLIGKKRGKITEPEPSPEGGIEEAV